MPSIPGASHQLRFALPVACKRFFPLRVILLRLWLSLLKVLGFKEPEKEREEEGEARGTRTSEMLDRTEKEKPLSPSLSPCSLVPF